MPYHQHVSVVGVVGKDAEIRTTPSGKRVLSFSLAYTEKRKDAGGSPQERTQWFEVSRWNPPDWMQDAIKKGTHVMVVGKVSARAYEKNGEARAVLELNAESVLPFDKRERQTATVSSAAGAAEDVPFRRID